MVTMQWSSLTDNCKHTHVSLAKKVKIKNYIHYCVCKASRSNDEKDYKKNMQLLLQHELAILFSLSACFAITSTPHNFVLNFISFLSDDTNTRTGSHHQKTILLTAAVNHDVYLRLIVDHNCLSLKNINIPFKNLL